MARIQQIVAGAAVAGGILVTGTALTAGPASAASAVLQYSCEYGVGDVGGSAVGSASFDLGIGEGAVVEARQTLSLDPFTGSVTLPDDFTQLLRDNALSSIEGGGESYPMPIEGGDGPLDVNFGFAATGVPSEGPLTVQVRAEGIQITPRTAGAHVIHAGDFLLFVDTGEEELEIGMFCALDDDGDTSVDAFRVTAAATSPLPPEVTVTATTTVTPVRPALVQTDFVEEGAGPSPLAVVLGAGLLALGGVAAGMSWTARRSASRRH